MLSVVVPMKATKGKSRLASVLDTAGREALTRQMLEHVLATLREAGLADVAVASAEAELNADVTAAACRVRHRA
jgi:2-phospho-L-lactate guanylyltransferase (CobY/MobA/RfbA family)